MLELKNISYFVGDKKSQKILDKISIVFKPYALTVITGPNGSGKSTLAEIIMGIKKPSKGQIVLEQTDIVDKSITDRTRLGIAFSFQQPVKFKGVNVYDLLNIASEAMISESEAAIFLKKVGLESDKYLYPEINDKLSGGELKRIEIASVLARNAKLIIFDEPEAGIDLWSFENLIKVFKRLKSEKRTLIIISHQERIMKNADEIVILENGRIKEKGSSASVLPKIRKENHELN